MSLIKWKERKEIDPIIGLFNMQDDLNSLFDLKFKRNPNRAINEWFVPALDVYEKDNKTLIKAELPGLEKKDIEISAKDHILTIKGKKEREQDIKEEHCRYIERSHGEFERSIRIEENFDPTKISASFKNGILEVTVPYEEEKKPNQITINVD